MAARRLLTAVVGFAAVAAPAQQDRVLFSEDFPCRGRFELHSTLFPETTERTADFPVKVTDLPDGRLLMVWGSTAGPEVDVTNRLWLSYSSDDGATWAEPVLWMDSTADSIVRNPCCYTHSDGVVFVFYNWVRDGGRFDVAYRTSRDSGATWTDQQVMVEAGLLASAIRLRSGRIVLPVCQVRPQDPAYYVPTVMLSDDGGKTWYKGGDLYCDIPRGGTEPTIAQLSNGDLYALIRTNTGYQYHSRSRDGGLTWMKPERSPFASPDATGLVWRLASGNLVFVWDNTELSGGSYVPRYPLFVALSEDDGKTWPYRKMIDTVSGMEQLSNHGVFQGKSGTLIVTYNHHVGTWDGKEHGGLDCARFDEAWIRSRLDPDKWVEHPAPTGGIRLDNEGVLLVSGANEGDQTTLVSKFPLPRRCVVTFAAADVAPEAKALNGFFISPAAASGRSPGRLWEAPHARSHDPVTVRIRIRDGRVRYEDSRGTKRHWTTLPEGITWPAQWGFFTRNAGEQGRVRIGGVALSAD